MEETPMDPKSLMFVDPATLSDEAASEMLDFLYEFISAFENHYANQLRRFHELAARLSQICLKTSTTSYHPSKLTSSSTR